jgi:hypothetical protein
MGRKFFEDLNYIRAVTSMIFTATDSSICARKRQVNREGGTPQMNVTKHRTKSP